MVGTIAVGLAVVIGITLFQISAVLVKRDQIVSDLVYLSSDAQAFYKKQDEYGGGEGSFTGCTIPEFYKKHGNNKKYIKIKVKKNKVTLNGYGTEIGMNGKSTVRARTIVTPTNNSITILIKKDPSITQYNSWLLNFRFDFLNRLKAYKV